MTPNRMVTMTAGSEDLTRAWRRALAGLRHENNGPAFDLWIDDVLPLAHRAGVVHLRVPNPLVQDLMTRRYAPALQKALSEALAESVEVAFQVGGEPADFADDPRSTEADLDSLGHDGRGVDLAIEPGAFASLPLNPRFTFDTFVVGPSNRFPHAAAQAIAKAPAHSYNPLFLYGGVGLGKTHLMQAIGQRLRALRPTTTVMCISGETFLHHFVTSIREDRTEAFRRCYRNVDLWLVDDIQFIASRESTRTEAEFFHTFNALHETNKQIVITSDRPPKELLIEDRLRSRFEMGLITDIKPPDIETRLAILQKRAAEEALRVSDEVLMYIAEVVSDSIRLLEGALLRVAASASLLGDEVTMELAQECLQDYSIGPRRRDVTAERIRERVAEHFALEPQTLVAKTRRQEAVRARQVAMYLSRELLDLSFADIGEHYGRDHSTVMHACSKIGDLLAADDPAVAGAVRELSAELTRGTGLAGQNLQDGQDGN